MRAKTTRLLTIMAIEALLVLIAPAGLAQEAPSVEIWGGPLTVSVRGEVVGYSIEIRIPDSDLPATITAITSDLHGDLTDPANPLLISTNCQAPVPYSITPGWAGMGCWYEVWLEGAPGDVSNTVSVEAQLADESEVTLSDTVVVTISEDLGAIRGTLIDSETGLPIPDTYVWGSASPGTGEDFEGFSDSSGTFFFDGLEPGQYRLTSGNKEHGTSNVPPGYRSEYAYEGYDEEPVGVPAGFPSNMATPITVNSGEIVEIEWELTRGGMITGRVTSADTGEPIGDYEVRQWIVENGSASPKSIGVTYGDVSSDGTYRLIGLREADYIICVETPYGSECWDDTPLTTFPPDAGDPVTVILGQTTSAIDFEFQTYYGNGEGGGNGDGEPADLPFTGPANPWLALTATALILAGVGSLVISHRLKTH